MNVYKYSIPGRRPAQCESRCSVTRPGTESTHACRHEGGYRSLIEAGRAEHCPDTRCSAQLEHDPGNLWLCEEHLKPEQNQINCIHTALLGP